MATIKEVVEKWDETHPNNPTETLKGKNVQQGGKIDSWSMYGRLDKWAVIRLADGYPFAKWNERICYVFDFKSGKPEITFQRRSGYPCDTEKLYELLDRFTNEKIKEKKLTLVRGRINPNNLMLSIRLDINSSAEEICACMEKLIKLTKEPICKFLEGKDKEELLAKSEESPVKNEDKIFLGIMNKYGIRKDGNKGLYGNCLEIYSQTIEILNSLYIVRKDAEKVLKVSYYTKKSIAQKLLIASKDENKYDEFRLYYTHGMNDPHEGKTLLQFLEIENEDLELPETIPFIACFSLEVDSLNQFRLYGKDNKEEATGVGIVFDFDFFDNGTNKEEKYGLYRCVYIDTHEGKISLSFSKKEDEEEKEKEKEENEENEIKSNQSEVEKLFEELREEIQDLRKETQDPKEETRKESKINDINKTELAKDLLIRIRYLVKDHAFMEERECRIINMINKENRSKINIDGDRLYINIGGVKNHVDEIYFAPLTEGMEAFEIETGIKCIRSRRPYNSKRQ